jgi:hypothetical protein
MIWRRKRPRIPLWQMSLAALTAVGVVAALESYIRNRAAAKPVARDDVGRWESEGGAPTAH